MGYLSTAMKCGLCEWWVCSKCHVPKGKKKNTPHSCKKADVKSVTALKKDCKPCPACSALIYKISGCDQMWCCACYTPFSWNKGTVIKGGHVHNPHFFEWQQQHAGELPENHNNLPCGGADIVTIVQKVPHEYKEELQEAYRILIHINAVEIPQYTERVPLLQRNEILRVDYLLGEIFEQRFKQRLRQNEKAADKQQNIREVLHMYTELATELFRRMEHHKSGKKILEEYEELEKIRMYANQSLYKIAKQYTMLSIIQIRTTGNPTRVKRSKLI